jgi:hypothetical protein
MNAVVLSCDPHPGSVYRATPDTVVEPGVGGVEGLNEGDRLRVEYSEECEEGCALIATRITVVTP